MRFYQSPHLITSDLQICTFNGNKTESALNPHHFKHQMNQVTMP